MKNNRQLLSHIIEWDVANWSESIKFWEQHVPNPSNPSQAKVLALGERNGGLSLWLGLKGYNVVCSDYEGVTQECKEMHAKYGVENLMTYQNIDIYDIPFEDNTFDLVICKSVIGGLKLSHHDKTTRTLNNQQLAVNEIKRVLKPEAAFFGAENMRGSHLLHQIRTRYKKGNVGWRHFKVAELKGLFNDYSTKSFAFFGLAPGLTNNTLINKCIYLFNKVLDKITPKSLKYIAFIIAKK